MGSRLGVSLQKSRSAFIDSVDDENEPGFPLQRLQRTAGRAGRGNDRHELRIMNDGRFVHVALDEWKLKTMKGLAYMNSLTDGS